MYLMEAKALTDALTMCQAVIGMGGKSESQSVVLQFDTGLRLLASNSVMTYYTDLPVTCKRRNNTVVTVLPAVLAAYARGVKTLSLDPTAAHLLVKGDRKVQAEVYYVGATELPEITTPDADADIESLAGLASTMLSRAASIRNRTDKQELSVQLEWTTEQAEMIVGDSHHVAVMTVPCSCSTPGRIAMTQERLSKILHIGKNFAAGENEVFAWRETEYLSIANQVTAVRRADSAKEAVSAKRTLLVDMNTREFKDALSSILGAAEETANVKLTLAAERVTCEVETASSRGKAVLTPAALRGTPRTVNVSVNHLQDCLGTIDGETVRLCVLANNIVSLESTDAVKIKTVAAMATRA